MIKKSYFIQCYSVLHSLGAFFLMGIALSGAGNLLCLYSLKTTAEASFSFVLLEILLDPLQLLLVIVTTLLSIFLLPEVIHRIKQDSLSNLGKSIIGTLRFRRFLTQATPQLPKNQSYDDQTKLEDQVLRQFNRSVKKSVLDIRNEHLQLFINIPKEAQSQKILRAHEEQIKEHLASLYPTYLISTFERQKFQLWLRGTKQTH
ncbi:hypothetical protein M2139_000458 [Enterococcus sp. PF1-24]|uniref:hypothetical protein n=1 Tax=unclassified Enterococcus TaxID=2608891 RepID=UPI002475267D|nr:MULTISPECIES: hypothetical protein [unclassified Enterococcus]MDH6363483.1 hypothetical protein [Enterococcus sp. PFB1-1]MDH6400577.1 hypothetical protein [Enterococcus sp. PF1-24]